MCLNVRIAYWGAQDTTHGHAPGLSPREIPGVHKMWVLEAVPGVCSQPWTGAQHENGGERGQTRVPRGRSPATGCISRTEEKSEIRVRRPPAWDEVWRPVVRMLLQLKRSLGRVCGFLPTVGRGHLSSEAMGAMSIVTSSHLVCFFLSSQLYSFLTSCWTA